MGIEYFLNPNLEKIHYLVIIMKCPNCGAELNNGLCEYCGTKCEEELTTPNNVFDTQSKHNKPKIDTSETLITTNTLHNVKLLEARAVRRSSGSSVRVAKGIRVGSGTSVSHQVVQHIATGDLVLSGNKVFFEGGGQSRTIDIKKINRVVYLSNTSGIRVSVSNRQKSMEFHFNGYTIDDGHRVANAILQGMNQVQVSTATGKKAGCYIATCVYGSYDAPQVMILRGYRDHVLRKKLVGRLFIKIYYAISPTIVKYCGDSKIFNKFFRKILNKKINKIKETKY
jgi:hypothetical protein